MRELVCFFPFSFTSMGKSRPVDTAFHRTLKTFAPPFPCLLVNGILFITTLSVKKEAELLSQQVDIGTYDEGVSLFTSAEMRRYIYINMVKSLS